MLTLEDLCKNYHDTQVLKHIDLKIQPNSVVGLAGASGSGKSTLLRLIQGLEKPDKGRIVCQARIGFMFQDFQLFPHMTVRDNILYAPRLHQKNKKKDMSEAVQRMIDTLGIADKMTSYPHELSGGQKQRVALVRSLAMGPDLLLCDEPTSGLDVATILDVVALLMSVKSMGVTMIIASHDLDFLTHISDHILVLKHGSIVASVHPQAIDDPIAYLKQYY